MKLYKITVIYNVGKVLVQDELKFKTWQEVETLAHDIAKQYGHITKIEEMK